LLLFGAIIHERTSQRKRRTSRNGCVAPREGGGNRATEAVARELIGAPQKPDIVKVLHSAVRAAERDHGVELLGDHSLARIGAQTRRRQIEQHGQLQLGAIRPAIDLKYAQSPSPSDNSIARRHAAVVFNPLSQTSWSIYGGLEAQMNPSLLTTFMESIV
jgi:hypothetical protein